MEGRKYYTYTMPPLKREEREREREKKTIGKPMTLFHSPCVCVVCVLGPPFYPIKVPSFNLYSYYYYYNKWCKKMRPAFLSIALVTHNWVLQFKVFIKAGSICYKTCFHNFFQKIHRFLRYFQKCLKQKFKKKKKWNISNGQELTPYSDYNVPYECKTNGVPCISVTKSSKNTKHWTVFYHFKATFSSKWLVVKFSFDGNRSKVHWRNRLGKAKKITP